MKLTAAAIGAATLMLASVAIAQSNNGAIAVAETEAIVKVIGVDRKARTATVRGPAGGVVTISVPPEAQNFDQVKVGSQFKVRYLESVAVFVSKGGQASASEKQTVRLAPKGGTPGGIASETKQITGKVEAVDYAARAITVRGPAGKILAARVADEAEGFAQISVGDTITLRYTQALAMEMISHSNRTGPATKQ